MSEPMKKHPTETLSVHDSKGRLYLLPKSVAKKYQAPVDSIDAEEYFERLDQTYTKPGLLLRGIRVREGYSQQQFAELINITQANLSKMENGKRAIGKEMAKRIAKRFDINYQMLL